MMHVRLNTLSIFLIYLIISGLHCAPIYDSTTVFLVKREGEGEHEGKHLSLQSLRRTTHQATVGKAVGIGGHGEVYDVADHNIPTGGHGVVLKRFHTTSDHSPQETALEIQHLTKVQQLYAIGMDEHGGTWVAMHKVEGKHLHDTAAYKHASESEDGKLELKEHAKCLMGDTQLHHAEEHNLVHKCVFLLLHLVLHLTCTSRDLKWSNVKFDESTDRQGKPSLHSAHFVDWGLAKAAPSPQGAHGRYTDEQKNHIVCYTFL
jgi:serine/threonine protein kinase